MRRGRDWTGVLAARRCVGFGSGGVMPTHYPPTFLKKYVMQSHVVALDFSLLFVISSWRKEERPVLSVTAASFCVPPA